MSKASGKAEFRTIAAKLEMGIRQKVFSDRLPNIRTLQEQFDVSKQTMTRALALLQKSGIVKFKGRTGMVIDRSALKKRKIALVAAWTDGRKKDLLSVTTAFIDTLNDMGFHVELIRGDNQQHNFFPEHVLSDFDAVILRSYLRHESAVKRFYDANIPFVCAAPLPWAPEVDSVEYDTVMAISQVAADLKKWGFKKIALLYSGNASGSTDQIYKEWHKIKKRLFLPRLSCDKVLFTDGDQWEKNAVLLLEHIKNMKEVPEVLIHFGGKFDQRMEYYRQYVPDYPFGMKVVYQESLWERCSISPEDIIIKGNMRISILTEAFCILLERLLDPAAPPIHRKVPLPVEYVQLPLHNKTS